MTDPRLEDHVVGLELQLVELVERHKEAQTLVGGEEEVARLEVEIANLQAELAASAELLVTEEDPQAVPASDAIVTSDEAGTDEGAKPARDAAPANT
ncbi:MAG: hypothetical protein M3O23_01225 [Actinomycetota bacterium]|nr:hypothetical protein [Actinomycetota bacterium]